MRMRASGVFCVAVTLAVAGCRSSCSAKNDATPDSAPDLVSPTPTTIALQPGEKKPDQHCSGQIVATLTPGRPVDYLALRIYYYVAGETGAPCKGAKDATACNAALVRARIPPGKAFVRDYLAYSRGDEVGTVAGKDVATFLAPIETPEEAAAAAVYWVNDPTSVTPPMPSCEPREYTKTPTGFETSPTVLDECGAITNYKITIARDGKVQVTTVSTRPGRVGCDVSRSPPGSP